MKYYLFDVTKNKMKQLNNLNERSDNTLVDELGDIYKIINKQRRFNSIKYDVELVENPMKGGIRKELFEQGLPQQYHTFFEKLSEKLKQISSNNEELANNRLEGFKEYLTGVPDIDRDLMGVTKYANKEFQKLFEGNIFDVTNQDYVQKALFGSSDTSEQIDFSVPSQHLEFIAEPFFNTSADDLNHIRNDLLISQVAKYPKKTFGDQIYEDNNNTFGTFGTFSQNNPQEFTEFEIDEEGNQINVQDIQIQQKALEGKARKCNKIMFSRMCNYNITLNENFMAAGKDTFKIKVRKQKFKYSDEDNDKLQFFYNQKQKIFNCLCEQDPQPIQIGGNTAEGVPNGTATQQSSTNTLEINNMMDLNQENMVQNNIGGNTEGVPNGTATQPATQQPSVIINPPVPENQEPSGEDSISTIATQPSEESSQDTKDSESSSASTQLVIPEQQYDGGKKKYKIEESDGDIEYY